MFGSDRGRGKYVSVCDILCIVCDILCIVEKLLERVLEDAAPCLTLPIHTVCCTFPYDGEQTETYIYMGSSDVLHPTDQFWTEIKQLEQEQEESTLGVTVPPRTHPPLKIAIAIKSLSFASLLCYCVMVFK